MAEIDYAYGETLEYGYGGTEPDMITENASTNIQSDQCSVIHRPKPYGGNTVDHPLRQSSKRRGSVTKFSLESSDTPTALTAASVIAQMRHGNAVVVDAVSPSYTMDDAAAEHIRANHILQDNHNNIMSSNNNCTGTNEPDTIVDDNENAVDMKESMKGSTIKRNGFLRMMSVKRS
jgi:Zn-dependent M28 family amino/carboxypeptidase